MTYAEAAEIGIDNLEHGFFANTELDPDKKPDTCSESGGDYTLEHMTPGESGGESADRDARQSSRRDHLDAAGYGRERARRRDLGGRSAAAAAGGSGGDGTVRPRRLSLQS